MVRLLNQECSARSTRGPFSSQCHSGRSYNRAVMPRVSLVVAVLAGCGFSVPAGSPGGDAAPDDASDALPQDGSRVDWWDARWSHRRSIELDNSKITGAIANFPILIELTPATVDYADVRPGGADLRFVAEDNASSYVFEIDSYVANGTSTIWVRIPTLAPGGQRPRLWMYYGNPSATSASNGTALWGSTYTSVHHLGSSLADASGNAHVAAPAGGDQTPAITGGTISDARLFDGNNNSLELSGEGSYDFTTTMCATLWIRVDVFDEPFQAILTKGDSSWRIQRDDVTNRVQFATTSNANPNSADGDSNVGNSQWHHIAAVMDGVRKIIYVDGVAEDDIAYTLSIDNNQRNVRIGDNQEQSNRMFQGAVDEVRITPSPRSPAWITAEHMTVTDAAFVTIGADERY